MRLPILLSLSVLCLSMVACRPQEEPEFMLGEDAAEGVVMSFMRALEAADYERARDFVNANSDLTLKDLPYCHRLFFSVEPTGLETLSVGHQRYAGEWHLQVDLKISYGDMMKQLRFTLVEGEPPLLRALNPILPE